MSLFRNSLLALSLVASIGLTGCSSGHVDHYVSPQIQGESAKINLDEVQKAFWDSQGLSAKGADFSTWMAAFEKRVNEIYEGKEIVSIDATRKDGKLVVTGYIDKLKQQGYKPGDDKLFSIEQTGDAVNNEMPYKVSNADNRVYYEGHHSILDNPILQVMLLHHMMGGFGGWGGSYYTPYNRYSYLDTSRSTWRSTPAYSQQQASNTGFFSRFKKNTATGSLQSKTGWGSGSFSSPSSSSSTRSFGGLSSGGSSSSTVSSSGWGGRRSGSTGLFSGGGSSFGRSRWGGRRR